MSPGSQRSFFFFFLLHRLKRWSLSITILFSFDLPQYEKYVSPLFENKCLWLGLGWVASDCLESAIGLHTARMTELWSTVKQWDNIEHHHMGGIHLALIYEQPLDKGQHYLHYSLFPQIGSPTRLMLLASFPTLLLLSMREKWFL